MALCINIPEEKETTTTKQNMPKMIISFLSSFKFIIVSYINYWYLNITMFAETDENKRTQQRTVTPFQFPDYTSALALTETRHIIESFFFDYCGIMRIKQPDGNYTFKRVSKPILTYDYADKLTSMTYILANRVTARTTFKEAQILSYCKLIGKSLMLEMAEEGINHIVSDKIWNKAIELYTPVALKVKGEKGEEEIVSNHWYLNFSVKFDYDEPFCIEHLNMIKNKFDLENEKFGQDVILQRAFWSLMTFIHASLNRSLDALTLDHEKVIHKESVTQSETSRDKRADETVLEGFKNRIKGMMGRSK